jgi:phosphonate transport system substrate-binding protein
MWFALLFTGLIGLTACQPREIVLEVTRIVETKVETQKEVVEVTRVVTQTEVQEATRLVTEELLVEVTKSPLGTAARPVQLLFSTSVDMAVIGRRGQVLAQALTEATGYEFAVTILDDEQTVIDLMCDAPLETIGFLSATAYVLAAEQCGIQPGSVAVNGDGLTWQSGMIVTRRDSGINTLADLEGKSWAVADRGSIPNFLYFQALLQEEGIEPGDIIDISGDSAAMLAVYEEEADFATADFVPPIMPYEERLWDYNEDDPEPGRFLGISPTRSPIGYVLVNGEPEFGGYRLRDARSRIFDVVPQIYDRTQIVTLSAQIPNDIAAFGHDFPLGLALSLLHLRSAKNPFVQLIFITGLVCCRQKNRFLHRLNLCRRRWTCLLMRCWNWHADMEGRSKYRGRSIRYEY